MPTPGGMTTREFWAHNIELITAIIGAIALIASIGFGVNRNQAANTSDSRAEQLSGELDAAHEALRRATSRATVAEQRVAELEAQIAATPSASPDPEAPTATDVRHQGPLVIADGQHADLDSLDDVRWETVNSDGGGDVYWRAADPQYLNRTNSANTVLMPDGTKAADCPKALGYDQRPISGDKVKAGAKICVLTTEERFSLLVVKSVARDGTRVTFDATTLKGAND